VIVFCSLIFLADRLGSSNFVTCRRRAGCAAQNSGTTYSRYAGAARLLCSAISRMPARIYSLIVLVSGHSRSPRCLPKYAYYRSREIPSPSRTGATICLTRLPRATNALRTCSLCRGVRRGSTGDPASRVYLLASTTAISRWRLMNAGASAERHRFTGSYVTGPVTLRCYGMFAYSPLWRENSIADALS